MTPEVRAHVFEPFFTTKPKGEGSGLGLSTVYGMVRQLSGQVGFTSSPSAGTEFQLSFPCVEAPATNVASKVPLPVPGGSETILVVEDEAAVRRFTVRVLRKLGYQVFEAEHGEAGLALCQARQEPIDLIFTDVVMPLLGGPEMVERARAARPNVPVLYATGFTHSAILPRQVAMRSDPVLLKPYTQESLALKIRQVLDAQIPGTTR
jgi:two-component system, cell cycle sensor histidine kinase and response regulator CckA